MSIVFNVANNAAFANGATMRNRRAAQRQSEAMRGRVFAKYQALVGTVYKNSLAARRAANAELNDRKKHEEYWNNDTTPRRNLNMSSSCFAKAIPSAGGIFLYFRSNPEKGYFYPAGGTTEESAKRLYKLLSSSSPGSTYHAYWGAQNGAKKRITKAGNTEYALKRFPKAPTR